MLDYIHTHRNVLETHTTHSIMSVHLRTHRTCGCVGVCVCFFLFWVLLDSTVYFLFLLLLLNMLTYAVFAYICFMSIYIYFVSILLEQVKEGVAHGTGKPEDSDRRHKW